MFYSMYKKKIPLDMDCGVAIAMEVMGGKWKSCILYGAVLFYAGADRIGFRTAGISTSTDSCHIPREG